MKTFLRRTVAAQTHLLASIAAIVGVFVLLYFASDKPDSRHFWACFIFGLTSVLVFVASTVFHFLTDGFQVAKRLEKILENFDHFAIYLFIAGTYTPFLLNAVSQPWSSILLAVIWITGIIGIFYTYFKPQLPAWARHRFVYTGIFVLMGWVLIFRISEVFQHLNLRGIFLLVAGGLSYTIGAIFYATERPKLFEGVFGSHELWHLMVMAGFGFHYFLILSFYLP